MMIENVSLLMFIFAGAILLYALLLAWTKDIRMIARHYAVKINDEKGYALKIAKILALVSIIPALSGITGIITGSGFLMSAVLIAGFVIFIVICNKLG
ncbi:MAG: hypothetical protein IJP48_00960 [Synergistaceae bacterium]|nr:hypothetical protein [Synergistaceae bacterium]